MTDYLIGTLSADGLWTPSEGTVISLNPGDTFSLTIPKVEDAIAYRVYQSYPDYTVGIPIQYTRWQRIRKWYLAKKRWIKSRNDYY